MRGRGRAMVLLAVAVATPARADMSVATFLMKAENLKGAGIMALASPDYDMLRGEVTRVARTYQAELRAAKASGRVPHSCPPENPALTPDDLLAHMRSIAPSRRKATSVRAAVYGMMAKRYPCRTG